MKIQDKCVAAFAPHSFKGKNIIVTGGGSGIGLCTAKQLAELGAKVFLFGRREDKLKRAVEIIKAAKGKADYLRVNICYEEKVIKAVSDVVERCGTIHGLVNNAGGQFQASLSEISQQGFEAVLKTNLTGIFLVSREVYNQSMSKTGGSIVNMLMNFWGGTSTFGHSGAARAGALNLTKTAAIEWGEKNVRVNAVAPGFIWSSGMEVYDPKTVEFFQSILKKVPIPRFGTEKEVSDVIIFLLSDLASYITGTSINIDGGDSLYTKLWPFPGDIKKGYGMPAQYLHKHQPEKEHSNPTNETI